MLTVNLPVGRSNQDKVVKWFSHVHNGSRIDFRLKDDSLVLINEENRELHTDVRFTLDELFEQLDPKTSPQKGSKWLELTSKRCSSRFRTLMTDLPNHRFTDREVFDLYMDTEFYDLSEKPAWFVGDIRWEYENPDYLLQSMLDQDQKMESLYCVRIEICAEYQQPAFRYKVHLEEKLAALYFDLGKFNHPEIPYMICHIMAGWRDAFVAKMMFALKGRVQFREVQYLDFLTDQIKKEKYPGADDVLLRYPKELFKDDVIDSPIYQFPKELTWADVISAMGTFSVANDDRERTVTICEDFIERTVRLMAEKESFLTDIVDAVDAVKEPPLYEALRNRKAGDTDVLSRIKDEDIFEAKIAATTDILKNLVIAHELGHMVLRKGNEYRITIQQESLANWFACLVSDQLGQEIIRSLLPYQGPDYQEFISIPSGYQLTKADYTLYWNKLNNALVEW